MAIRVLFFGATAELVGKKEVAVLTPGSTVAQIVERLFLEYPALTNLDLKFAVNHEFASRETPVGWCDELAIFTPVSGG